MAETKPIFIRISQISEQLQMSKSTIKRWIKRGIFIEPLNSKLPNCCKTTELFFLRADFDNWLAQFKK